MEVLVQAGEREPVIPGEIVAPRAVIALVSAATACALFIVGAVVETWVISLLQPFGRGAHLDQRLRAGQQSWRGAVPVAAPAGHQDRSRRLGTQPDRSGYATGHCGQDS